eukprot:4037220-Amphidinium_carterae.1
MAVSPVIVNRRMIGTGPTSSPTHSRAPYPLFTHPLPNVPPRCHGSSDRTSPTALCHPERQRSQIHTSPHAR